MNSFQQDVIEKSFEKPVVVDFWAAWCGPCRVLGPVIEGIAAEQSDRWELVKVDTEAHQDIAQQYKIMSIPAVKMFSQGKIVAEFTGALPKSQILKWLDESIPDPRKSALNALVAQVYVDPSSAIAPLEAYCQENEDLADAWYALAQALIWSQPDRALEVLNKLPVDGRLLEKKQQFEAIQAVLNTQEGEDATQGPVLVKAAQNLHSANWAGAIEALIESISLNKGWGEARARKAAVALFAFLGPRHPIAMKYHRRFSSALN